MSRIPGVATQARVRDLDGAEHAFEELWREKTALIAFLRHFG